MKVLITGGHITPAIRLIEILQSYQDQIELVSSRFASTYSLTKSLDPVIAKKYKIPHHYITQCKYHRHKGIISIVTAFPSCIVSIFQSIKLIHLSQPDIVVSFGGNISLPVCTAAYILRIPIIIHEQTTQAGVANRLVAKIAAKITISYSSSIDYFPAKKTILTGNLIRQEFSQSNLLPPSWWNKSLNKPIIYITGGNQGSNAINQTMFKSINQLSRDYLLIHQIGRSGKYDYQTQALDVKQSLTQNKKTSYIYKPWFEVQEVAWLMKQALLVISRSGANTVSELIISKTVSILIPLPYAANREQLKNAQLIHNAGGGVILHQDKLQPHSLVKAICLIKDNYHNYKNGINKLALITPYAGSKEFYQLIRLVAKKESPTS